MKNSHRNRLRDLIGTDAAVFDPDHPLLTRAPEVLVKASDSLCALFLPRSVERNNPAHLATRLIASRLALPRDLKTVLVLEQEDQGRFETLTRHFSLTTSLRDRSLKTFLNDRGDYGRSVAVDPKTQALAAQNYGASLDVSERAFRLSRVQQGPRAVAVQSYYMPEIDEHIENDDLSYDPRNRVAFRGDAISVLRARQRSGLVRQLNATASGHLLASYRLDQGVPIPHRIRTHLTIAEHAEDNLSVRSKVIHAAAFCGLAVLPSEDPAVLEESAQLSRRPTFGAW